MARSCARHAWHGNTRGGCASAGARASARRARVACGTVRVRARARPVHAWRRVARIGAPRASADRLRGGVRRHTSRGTLPSCCTAQPNCSAAGLQHSLATTSTGAGHSACATSCSSLHAHSTPHCRPPIPSHRLFAFTHDRYRRAYRHKAAVGVHEYVYRQGCGAGRRARRREVEVGVCERGGVTWRGNKMSGSAHPELAGCEPSGRMMSAPTNRPTDSPTRRPNRRRGRGAGLVQPRHLFED